MKFNVNEILPEGLELKEEISVVSWDMETALIKFKGPISAKAMITREDDDIFVDLSVKGTALEECSRCAEIFKVPVLLNKRFLYSAKTKPTINMDPDIREEIMLDYPIKPLCKPDCKGLCPVCGMNLNEGGCNCKMKP